MFTNNNNQRETNLSFEDCFKNFKERISNINPQLSKKKYYYVNIWTLVCPPCIQEMSILHDLAENWPTDIACLFVSNHSQKAVQSFLKKYSYSNNRFNYVNNLSDFIYGLCGELEINNSTYPIHAIITEDGKILAYMVGAFVTHNDSRRLNEFIMNLN